MRNKLVPILLAILMIASFAPQAVFALAEAESNDVFADAQTFQPGDEITGEIGEKDVDLYSFTLTASGNVAFDVTAYMQYHSFRVYDSEGKQLHLVDGKQWNANVGFVNHTVNFDLEVGTYFIELTGRRDYDYSWYRDESTGKYTVKTSFTPSNSTEKEENDELMQANSLEVNDSVIGQIAVNDYTDFYKVELTEAGRLSVSVRSYMKFYSLQLFNALGEQLWVTDGNEWNANVGYLDHTHNYDLDAGVYFFQITGRRDYDMSWYSDTSTGTYTLTTSFVSAEATEKEENDTLQEANALDFDNPVTGQIAMTDEMDFYKVVLPESGRLALDMTAYLKFYSLQLFDISGTSLWLNENNQWNANVGYLNEVHNLDLDAGTYFIEVTGRRDADLNWYSDKSTGNYTLKAAFVGASATETEENDKLDVANDLGTENEVVGQIAINDKFDFFKVILPESGRLQLNMTSYMQYYSITVYDTAGTNLWLTEGNQWNSAVNYRNDVHNLDLEAGTYFIEITGRRDADKNWYSDESTGTYALKTAFTGANATEQEDNDSTDAANPLELDAVTYGQIAINDKYDFYTVTLPYADELKLTITSRMQYYTLHVLNEAGTELWYDDRNEWNADVGFRSDEYTVNLEAGTYFIKVTGYKRGTEAPSTGTYILLLNHEHVWDSGVVTKLPSGDKAGEKTFTCEVCGLTKIEEYKPCGENDHEWEEATCDKPKMCTKCGGTEGKPLGHDWVDATCDAPKTCARCDLTEGEPLEHEWEDATCEKPKTCKLCQAIDGEPLGHDWEDATCAKPKTCKRCEAIDGKPVDHKFEDDKCIYCGGHKGDLAFLLGDANLDGEVTYLDAMTILQAAVSLVDLSPDLENACDVDGNGEITYMDAMLVLQKAVGLLAFFPVEQ